MIGIPERDEAAPYYFRYIDLIADGNILQVLRTQMEEALSLFSGISEENLCIATSRRSGTFASYWAISTMRSVCLPIVPCHFARGDAGPLPGFDQEPWVSSAQAEAHTWASHVEDFQAVRLSTITMLRNFPAEAWAKRGVASDSSISVRALALSWRDTRRTMWP